MFQSREFVLSVIAIPALLVGQPAGKPLDPHALNGSGVASRASPAAEGMPFEAERCGPSAAGWGDSAMSIGFCGVQPQAGGAKQNKKTGRAEQFVRDAARLDGIKTIAVVPVVIQIRFDREKHLPDPAKMRARIASAAAIPALLMQSEVSPKFKFLTGDEVSRAFAELHCTPTDMYIVKSGASWDAPAEVLKGSKEDEVALCVKREEMKHSPDECSLFRYKLHDIPEPTTGLASYKPGMFAHPDMEKVKVLREKLGVDAVLFLQVTDIDDQRGYTASALLLGGLIFGQRAEKTQVRVQATLVGSGDIPTIWQATARGVKSHSTGVLHAGNMKSEMDKQALQCTEDAVQTLLSDLCEGTGVPAK